MPRILRTLRRTGGLLDEARDVRRPYTEATRGMDLVGAPGRVKVDGLLTEFGGYRPAQDAARSYVQQLGLAYDPIRTYKPVDVERAGRIAQAYDQMAHAPDDPRVRRSYDAMIRETADQFRAAQAAGLKVDFYPESGDPYGDNPRNALLDLVENNHLYVYPTDDGFGTGADFDPGDSPLLGDSGISFGGRPAKNNDVFRAVHDYFGHGKYGVGFRADGEENAWRSHASMYTPEARGAVTSETRGQNSWLNYGPYGAKNRTAKTGDSIFADQKLGLLPPWAMREGLLD